MRRLLVPLAAAAALLAPTPASAINRQPRRAGRVPGPGRPARGHRREPGLRPLLRRHPDRQPAVRHRGQLRHRSLRRGGGAVEAARQARRHQSRPGRARRLPRHELRQGARLRRLPADERRRRPHARPRRELRAGAGGRPHRDRPLEPPEPSPPSWAGAGSAPRELRAEPPQGRHPDHRRQPLHHRLRRRVQAGPDDVRRRSARHLDATARDFCEGDEGGPLLVPDGSSTGRVERHRLLAQHDSMRRPHSPGRLHAVDRRRAQPLDPQQDAGGRLRPQPPAARRRAGDADLDLLATPKAPTTSRPSAGTSTTTAPSTTPTGARSRTPSPPRARRSRASRPPSLAATRRRSTTRSTSSPLPAAARRRPPPRSCRPSRRRPKRPRSRRSSPPSARR